MHSKYRPWFAVLLAGAVTVLSAAEVSQAQFAIIRNIHITRMPLNAPQAAPAVRDAAGLHLPRNKQVFLSPQVLTDGGQFRWDIYQNLNLANGTNNAYNGGMNPQINNQGFGSNGQAFVNKDGDEFEIGPFQVSNVIYSRRVKVYKDAPLARWIDIFENPGNQEITVNFAVYSSFCWQISGIKTNSGKNTFAEGDWGVITSVQGNPNVPVVLHIVCDKKSKVRPQIQVQNNQFWVRYAFRIPPRGVAALCYFESQNKAEQDHMKFMGDFKPSKYFKDIPGSVRKLIVNFSNLGGGVTGVELDRSETADSILMQNKDPMFGKITNQSYTLQTLFGEIELKASQVVGMVSRPGGEVVCAMTDGQVISGKLPDGAKLNFTLSTGGDLAIAMDGIGQWSYQIDKARPADISLEGPTVTLRTGDQLLFDAKALKLDFSTRHGKLQLRGGDLTEIDMDNTGNGVHKAVFTNGSSLAGLLEGQNLAVPINKLTFKNNPKMELPRDLILKFSFTNDDQPDPSLAHVTLNNDDEFYARWTQDPMKLTTDSGTVDIRPGDVKFMTFSPTHMDRVMLTLFDKTVLRGQLDVKDLNFQIVPGPALKISTAQMVALEQTQCLPNDEVSKKAEQFIARLGAESYLDREKATEDLGKLGDAVMPILKKHLKDSDPEVRQRLLRVIEKLGGKADMPGDQPAMMMIENQ